MTLFDRLKKKSKYISIFIVLHHYAKHRLDPTFSLLDKFVQYKDINNHEMGFIFLGYLSGSKK